MIPPSRKTDFDGLGVMPPRCFFRGYRAVRNALKEKDDDFIQRKECAQLLNTQGA